MLVEDDVHVRRGLARAFREFADVVAFPTIAAAEPRLEEHWDGMIIDRGMPDGCGLAFARSILVKRPKASIVLFTGAAARDVLHETQENGIIYAHKIDGIQVVKTMVASWARATRPKASPASRLEKLASRVGLTDREREVVELALAGLSRVDAARELGISPHTHRAHVTNILKKTRHARLSQLVASLSSTE